MQNGYNTNKPELKEPVPNNETTIIQTDVGEKDGQDKCPKCGATDISLNAKTGKLRCNFCRSEFEPQKLEGMVTNLKDLKGEVIASGATDIIADTNDMITLKCSSCGAEVVIDTSSATQARCHWCRNTLSINEQIPNGSIPDVVLPFGITKEVAKQEIGKFVRKRNFYAHPKFKQEFSTENVMGVYFPYMVIDFNAHAHFSGQGEHLVRSYVEKNSNNNTVTYYDADLYAVERDFDIVVEGLTVESSANKLIRSQTNTNNVINAIMPFDLENCVRFNANYLKGYTSEKRDVNMSSLKDMVGVECKDIVRYACNDTIKDYDRGVAWATENLDVIGSQWKSAYLPVWLYSYQEVKGEKKLLHYVAVNARTKEVMGSVPIYYPKLIFVSFLVEILGFLAFLYSDFEYSWLFLTIGFIYFFVIMTSYRNQNARHKHETETKKTISNLKNTDQFIQSRKRLTNGRMTGANNTRVNGASTDLVSQITEVFK